MRKEPSQQCSSANLLGSWRGRGGLGEDRRIGVLASSTALLVGALLWCVSGVAQGGASGYQGYSGNSGSTSLVQLQRKAESGSHTVAVKGRDILHYNSSAPLARKKGSGQGVGVEDKVGFRCGNGRQWAIVKGEISCGTLLTLGGEAAALLAGGRSLFVQAGLIGGFRTGRFLRITGSNMDVRVDMFALDGSVTGSCFLTQELDACHLGSPNSANSGLAAVPQFPTTGGQMRYASDLVEGNLVFAGTLTGGALQDAYIASVVKTNSVLTVYFVGLHHLDGLQGNQLRPIYSRGSFPWDALAGMMGNATDVTWVTSSSWSANTP
jgi:hypothetical protein